MSKAVLSKALSELGFSRCRGSDIKHGTHKLTVVQAGQRRSLFVVAKTVGDGTINQIRPYRCVPLILWDIEQKIWYLISAIEILRFAAPKNNGQHTESPFECCNLNIRALSSYECGLSQLVSKVEKSYAELESIPRVRALMADHKLNFQETATQTKAQVRAMLSEL